MHNGPRSGVQSAHVRYNHLFGLCTQWMTIGAGRHQRIRGRIGGRYGIPSTIGRLAGRGCLCSCRPTSPSGSRSASYSSPQSICTDLGMYQPMRVTRVEPRAPEERLAGAPRGSEAGQHYVNGIPCLILWCVVLAFYSTCARATPRRREGGCHLLLPFNAIKSSLVTANECHQT